MLGIIGGTALLAAKLPPLQKQTIATPFGTTDLYRGTFIFIPRHQKNTPPHNINHKANLAACKILGVDRLILIGSSTGGMKQTYRPGTLVLPDDYYAPWLIPTLHDNDIRHVPPAIDPRLRQKLADLIPDALSGTYLQTRGPRFETRAEIQSLAPYTDIVGMTIASELRKRTRHPCCRPLHR